MTPRQWSNRLVALLDLIALSALAFTQEVRIEYMLAILGIYVVSRIAKFRLSATTLTISLASIVILALIAFFAYRIHPGTVAAFGVPAFHALLWFRAERGAMGWRIGLGFMELVLATTLTADLYLSVSITLFSLVATVAIACDFLDQQLEARGARLANQLLPQGFVSRSLKSSLLIIFCSALIFPILPRMKNELGLSQDFSRVGYTEEVSLSDWTKLSGTQGGSVVLWLYPKEQTMELRQMLHLGLFRGKALEIFDGRSWNSDPRKSPRDMNTENGDRSPASSRGPSVQIEAVRGPLRSDVLPVPYGTYSLTLVATGGKEEAPRIKTGEWIDRSSFGQKVRYEFEFVPFQLEGVVERDRPSQSHLFIPQSVRTDRFQRLADRLFRGAQDTRSKLDRVLTYFKDEGFKAAPEGSDDITREASSKAGFSPLEHFLFIGKQGHCEWFASSTALLLRAAGVPTRLVSGFRLTQSPIAGVVTVRNSDAHAWVEYWLEGRGWLPVDPSPKRVLGETSAWDRALLAYDVAAGYWFRYILSFDEGGDPLAPPKTFSVRARQQLRDIKQSTEEHSRWVLGGTLFLGVIVLLGFWFQSRKTRLNELNWEGPTNLRRERKKLERLLKSKDDQAKARAMESIQKWHSIYEQARFAKQSNESLEASLQELKNARKQTEHCLKSTENFPSSNQAA